MLRLAIVDIHGNISTQFLSNEMNRTVTRDSFWQLWHGVTLLCFTFSLINVDTTVLEPWRRAVHPPAPRPAQAATPGMCIAAATCLTMSYKYGSRLKTSQVLAAQQPGRSRLHPRPCMAIAPRNRLEFIGARVCLPGRHGPWEVREEGRQLRNNRLLVHVNYTALSLSFDSAN